MDYKKLAFTNHLRFSKMDGCEYIASYFAIEIILKIIKKYKVKNVLELGLGIGSISDTVLRFSSTKNHPINYVGTEKNEFCLEALKSNVADYNMIHLYPELKEIPPQKFDLIIIDGYDDSLRQIESFCHDHTIIFIEGDRQPQTKNMLEVFPKAAHVNIITLKTHHSKAGYKYIGGGQLIFINPTIVMKSHWLKEKVKTFVKRKLRKYENAQQ